MLFAALALVGCRDADTRPATRVTISGSGVGKEGALLRSQIARFERLHPDIDVVQRPSPDAADQRHQLYVQWLNARVGEPDILQLDVIWTPEFAAAGWILPLDRFGVSAADFFPAAIEANRYRDQLFALPWFMDAGLLYWRTDLMDAPPQSLEELERVAFAAMQSHRLPYGLVWQGARYEGLVTTFLEHLGAFGGEILDGQGRPALARPEAAAALGFMRSSITSGLVPQAALTWQEEQTRFAFQNGEAVFMRNWPYAAALLQDPARSKVAGRFSVAPMPPAAGGRATAALGGSQLAINAHSRHPEAAFALVEFLTAPEQMLERARLAGELPARPSLFDERLAGLLPASPSVLRDILEAARPRPVTPVYTELSEVVQLSLHRALTGQQESAAALRDADAAIDELLVRAELLPGAAERPHRPWLAAVVAAALLAAAAWWWTRRRRAPRARAPSAQPDAKLGWLLSAPALSVIALMAAFPLAWTLWESLHAHDLRMPWQGRRFVGLANYAELAASARVREALAHTAFFTAASVALEMSLGLALALILNRTFRARGLVRAAVLVPWAIPAVVAGLIWRAMFDSQAGIVNALLATAGLIDQPFVWFTHASAAWAPVILADVWKTTPFVALLLLAGLQGIDPALYEAAHVDGASALQQLRHITLPLLKPALLVALLFRSLDAFRVFDLVYVLTGGGPGTATEPLSLLTFNALLHNLRFGFGAALSVLMFVCTVVLAWIYVRWLGAELTGGER